MTNPAFSFDIGYLKAVFICIVDLLQTEWGIFSIYDGGNMEVRIFRRKYSSSRNP